MNATPASEHGSEEEGRPDDGLLARLHAAGQREREQPAPAHLQGRLERAYAARRVPPAFAGLPLPMSGRWTGLSAACAVATCIAIAMLWRPTPSGSFAPEHRVADMPRSTLVANDRARPPGGSISAPASAPRQPALAGGPSSATTPAPRAAAGTTVSRGRSDARVARLTVPASPVRPAPASEGTGEMAAAIEHRITDARTLRTPSIDPLQGLPDLRLDAAALRMVTTAPMLPHLPLRAPSRLPSPSLPTDSQPSGQRDSSEERLPPAAGGTLPTTKTLGAPSAQRIA